MMVRRDRFRFSTRNLSAFASCSFALVLLVAMAAPSANSQTWKAIGPEGGDARSLAFDPANSETVYLGTTDGHIFGSLDGGRHWELLGLAGSSPNAIVTSLVVDSRSSDTLFASTWTRESRGEGGGIYVSHDGGRTWRASGLAGHAVRALVASPSDPNTLVAGALDGVFRSRDAGRTWELLTPSGDPELRNFDSLAIDPRDSRVIYAGTFHLPWKTIDGGENWFAVHGGMIDDSDVLSLAVNPSNPEEVFASACSGIYRSDDAGSRWRKVQGIPYSSRRTPVIRLDPSNPGTLYAGTTEGLWKSTEGGSQWRRITPSDWVINSLAILPSRDGHSAPRILIGTEQQGVLATAGPDQFESANEGFQHRRVVSVTLDRNNPLHVGAVLANAADSVVQTQDGGQTWSPLGSGLEPGSVRRLFSTPDGWRVSLLSGGMMRVDSTRGTWTRTGTLVDPGQPHAVLASTRANAGRANPVAQPFRAVVNDLAFSDSAWFAATSDGLFVSSDNGMSWSPLLFSPLPLPVSSVRVSASGEVIRMASSHGMVFSDDAGHTWKWHDLPLESYGAQRLEMVDETTLVATSPRGLYVSRDSGDTWTKVQAGLPAASIDDLLIEPDFWAVSVEKGGLYLSRDRGANWSRVDTSKTPDETGFFPVLQAGSKNETIYAGSANDGLFLLDLNPGEAIAAGTAAGH